MTPEQARRLLARLPEYKADPESRLAALDDIQRMCIEGIAQEKSNPKLGVVTVIEIVPDVARRCIADKGQIAAELMEIANSEQEDKSIQFVINVERLEV